MLNVLKEVVKKNHSNELLGFREVKVEEIKRISKYIGETMEFGIKEVIKVDESSSFIPMVRSKAVFIWGKWNQIIRVEDTYREQGEIEDFNLTWEGAIDRIEGYKKAILKKDGGLTKQEIIFRYQ